MPAPVMKAGAATQRSPDASLVNPCFASSCDELRPKDEHGVVAIVATEMLVAMGSQNTVSSNGILEGSCKVVVLRLG